MDDHCTAGLLGCEQDAAWRALADGAATWGAIKASERRPRARRLAAAFGLPPLARPDAWHEMSGARLLQEAAGPGTYRRALDAGSGGGFIGPRLCRQIEVDVLRTFAEHRSFFRDPASGESERGVLVAADAASSSCASKAGTGSLAASLRRVLRAVCVLNPRVGYVQGLNYIAGLALVVHDAARVVGGDGEAPAGAAVEARAASEERCVWFVHGVTSLVWPGLFEPRLSGCRVAMQACELALRERVPRAAKALEACGLGLSLVVPRVLLSGFVSAMPMADAARCWDAVLFAADDGAREGRLAATPALRVGVQICCGVLRACATELGRATRLEETERFQAVAKALQDLTPAGGSVLEHALNAPCRYEAGDFHDLWARAAAAADIATSSAAPAAADRKPPARPAARSRVVPSFPAPAPAPASASARGPGGAPRTPTGRPSPGGTRSPALDTWTSSPATPADAVSLAADPPADPLRSPETVHPLSRGSAGGRGDGQGWLGPAHVAALSGPWAFGTLVPDCSASAALCPAADSPFASGLGPALSPMDPSPAAAAPSGATATRGRERTRSGVAAFLATPVRLWAGLTKRRSGPAATPVAAATPPAGEPTARAATPGSGDLRDAATPRRARSWAARSDTGRETPVTGGPPRAVASPTSGVRLSLLSPPVRTEAPAPLSPAATPPRAGPLAPSSPNTTARSASKPARARADRPGRATPSAPPGAAAFLRRAARTGAVPPRGSHGTRDSSPLRG